MIGWKGGLWLVCALHESIGTFSIFSIVPARGAKATW